MLITFALNCGPQADRFHNFLFTNENFFLKLKALKHFLSIHCVIKCFYWVPKPLNGKCADHKKLGGHANITGNVILG